MIKLCATFREGSPSFMAFLRTAVEKITLYGITLESATDLFPFFSITQQYETMFVERK